jgi:O-antigen ligase
MLVTLGLHKIQKRYLDTLYIYSVVITLMLFFFSNDENLGLGKIFIIPCAFSFILSFFLKNRLSKIDKWLLVFFIVTLISVFLYYDSSVPFFERSTVRMIVAFISFKDIKNYKARRFFIPVLIFSPIVIFLHYRFSDLSLYRYGGFYDDPNYLAVVFEILILICLLSAFYFKSLFVKVLASSCVVSILPLILAGLSRGGAATTVILLLGFAVELFKRNRKLGIVIVSLVIFLSASFSIFYSDRIGELMGRFQVLEQSNLRNQIDTFALKAFLPDKADFIFGIGQSNTSPHNFYKILGKYTIYRVHDTYVSILIEEGILGALVFFYVLILFVKKVIKQKNHAILRTCMLISVLINFYSVYCLSFLGFWWIFFYLQSDWDD